MSRYLHRLSHESMILYLFLVVVGDREGRSFYSDRSITEILPFSDPQLHHARDELIAEGLIRYPRPYWGLNVKRNWGLGVGIDVGFGLRSKDLHFTRQPR